MGWWGVGSIVLVLVLVVVVGSMGCWGFGF
jgi:hypothetical protein